ncbi:hypothetical protein H2203_003811 [Taxawa tesnikishii (nom. ined.)]|nr:hypothetical protein H2203_003811 [Dothideales sp. JES 119]
MGLFGSRRKSEAKPAGSSGKKSKKLTKQPPPEFAPRPSICCKTTTNSLRLYPNSKFTAQFGPEFKTLSERQEEFNSSAIDKDTGERKDLTVLMHGLQHRESDESILYTEDALARRKPGEPAVASLPSGLWQRISSLLSPRDAASLAYASKTLLWRLGYDPWDALALPENYQDRVEFLNSLQSTLPRHLFCFICAKYHLRIQPGLESLKATNVLNPLFDCPNAQVATLIPPRTRITPDAPSPSPLITRRWKEPDTEWSHTSRFCVYNNHLLMRVVSTSFAGPNQTASSMRHLLYSREDYTPYFSMCAHWQDGELMTVCKCALGHIPKLRERIGTENVRFIAARPQVVTLCEFCRPMRRCPECPTEYLVELRLVEDKNDNFARFKQAIVVTRWADLGDGSTPMGSKEWAAINGINTTPYNSFIEIGRRAVSGCFESTIGGDHAPGQRLLSLNPKNEKKGEEGNDWY